MESLGLTVTDVLLRAHDSPFSTRCDLARYEAETVAACAVAGLITTVDYDNKFGNRWRITQKGLDELMVRCWG